MNANIIDVMWEAAENSVFNGDPRHQDEDGKGMSIHKHKMFGFSKNDIAVSIREHANMLVSIVSVLRRGTYKAVATGKFPATETGARQCVGFAEGIVVDKHLSK